MLDLFDRNHIIEHVEKVGNYLEQELDKLAEEFDCIETRRGVGLMQGLVFKVPVGAVINRALEKGLVLINAGTHILRFVPPLIITEEHVDAMTAILRECIKQAEAV